MISIKEGSLGSGFWVRQAKRYRNNSEKNITLDVMKNKIPSYVLPRLYKGSLLGSVFIALRRKIPSQVFNSIGYGEHHMIFQEALSFSQSLFYYGKDDLIKHYEDDSAGMIYSKYMGYGKDQIVLNYLPEYKASKLSSHLRETRATHFLNNAACLPLISLRTFSFFVGMCSRRLLPPQL